MDTTIRCARIAWSAAIGAAVLLAVAAAAGGQPGGAGPSAPKAAPRDRNAALEYMTLQEQMDKNLSALVSEEWRPNDADWVPSEKLSLMLEDNQRLIKRLIETSRLPNYDMQLRYEEGFSLIVPHLGHIRQFTRVLATDARRLALAGRGDEAAERLASALRMARHVSDDRLLISSLVAVAVVSTAHKQAEQLAAEGLLGERARREYIRAARALLSDDPFGVARCLAMERTMAMQTMRPIVENSGAAAGKDIAAQLRRLQISSDGVKAVAAMTHEEAQTQVDLMDRYYAALVAAWGKSDTPARLEDLEKRLQAGDFGVLMREIGPALSRAHVSVDKAIRETRAIIALLEAAGQPAAQDEDEHPEQDHAEGQ